VDHLRREVAVHEIHLGVAADLLHLERAVARHLPYYTAVDLPVLIFPSVEAHLLPEEVE
jgi:hypothetical protein